MADWSGLLEAKKQGYVIGKDSGGKLSGLGIALKEVASKLEEKRQTATALETLGKTEQIKQMYNPPKWEPTTKEEALTYEKEKSGIKNQPQSIVDKQGNVIGTRPAGSVFQPSATIDEIINTLGGGGQLPGIKANVPQATPVETSNRVNVISPDGKRGSIPKEQLQEALANGFKRTL